MGILDGQRVNQAFTNAGLMSRNSNTDTIGTLDVNNTTDSSASTNGALHTTGGLGVEKSAKIGTSVAVGTSLTVGTTATITGQTNVVDVVSTGDVSLSGLLTAGNATIAATLIAVDIECTTITTDDLIVVNPPTLPGLTVSADAQFDTNVVIDGNLTVNGTTVTLNTATVDSEDPNITINKNGDDTSSIGAGLTVDRTGTKGSLIYDTTLASKFKVGDLASEQQIATVGHVQTLTNKTLTSPIISSISNTGVLTLPTSTDTLVGRATTDTLTNKTLTSPALTTPGLDVIIATQQGSTPSNPSAGFRKLYAKAGGFYDLNSSGVETLLGSAGGSSIYGRVQNGAGSVMTNGAFTIVPWATVDYDFGSGFDGVNKYTVTEAGLHRFNAVVTLTAASAGTGIIIIALYKNGVALLRGLQIGINTSNPSSSLSLEDDCAINDYYQIYVFHSNGANRALEAGSLSNSFSVSKG